MKNLLLLLVLIPVACKSQNASLQPITPFELSNQSKTATFQESIDFYDSLRKMAVAHALFAKLDTMGGSDIGKPILVFVLSNPLSTKAKTKILINNNIHPGEPEGVDASMLLCRELVSSKSPLLDHADLYVVLMYNVDGTCIRNCCSRANQNGPIEVGFRGNARNLDLNRDFIKADSRNAQSFIKYMQRMKFDLFIDNHTSNGADYPYTLTYFHTRPEKLALALRSPLDSFNAYLYRSLLNKNWPTVPYVEIVSKPNQPYVPENGLYAFWEGGRYATGFTALHHCIGFTVETHMLKPFPDRVKATKDFLRSFLEVNAAMAPQIIAAKRSAWKETPPKFAAFQWTLDMNHPDSLLFNGYKWEYRKSEVTQQNRLYFDHTQPWTKKVPYYDRWIPTDSALIPAFYLIPQAWTQVIERLEWNGIKLIRLSKDTIMKVGVKYLLSYQTVKEPYEGHYLHYQINTRDTILSLPYFKGDYLVDVSKNNWRFLVSVLEPKAPDSYFAWNFFDGILMQKEGFSGYVFEELAAQILKEDPALNLRFQEKRNTDTAFASDGNAQLNYIYKNSKYFEPSHLRYPVTTLPRNK